MIDLGFSWGLLRVMLAPDEGGGGGDTGSRDTGDDRGPEGTPHPGEMTATAEPPAAQPETGETPATATAPTTTPTAPTPEAAAPEYRDIRDYASRVLGLENASGFADDRAFLHALAAQAQQAQVAQQQAQLYAQQQASLLAQLQAAQARPTAEAQAPAKPSPWWNPPEYNPSWEGLVQRDEQGNLTLRPGAPADILPKYLAYQNYRRDFADRLLNDPVKTLQPMIAEVAQQQARELLESQMYQFQEEAYAQQFTQANSSWLHRHDAQGNVMRDPVSQQPLLSPVGHRFRDYVNQAHELGIRGSRAQEGYARSLLQRDILMEERQSAPPGAAPGAVNPVTAANRRPNQGGMLPAGGGAPNPNLSLADQLRAAFAAEGITDEMIDVG